VRNPRVEHRVPIEDRPDVGLAFGGASSRYRMADGLPASGVADSCNSLVFWAVAPLASPLPPRAFGVLRPPDVYGLAASSACGGGAYHSASPESIDLISRS
jgi:hypothetical protein